MTDMVSKKRQASGIKNSHAKLTNKEVLNIRNSKGFNHEIAEKFNVTASLISMILNRKIWKHI
jgi:hypothetical protein